MNIFFKQFAIHTLVPFPSIMGLNIDFTNSSLCMVVATLLVMLFLWLSTRSSSLVPTSVQAFGESIFEFIVDMTNKIIGPEGVVLSPLVMTIFVFVIGCNMIGLVPHSFTATSHVAVTLCMSVALIIFLTVYGVYRCGLSFFSVFLPHGVPLWLAPLIVTIESITYLFRTVSLSLRLTSNMVAGHVMLKVIAVLGAKLLFTGLLIVPTIFLAGLTLFEFFVAVLQAYIFAVLSCVYLSDAFKKH